MTESPTATDVNSGFRWTIAATVLAVVGVAGSLWLSLGMNLKACPLCLYQRAFMASAASVLLVGLLTDVRRSAIVPLLALPAALAGLGVAVLHEYLELTGKLECPAGIFGIGSAPQQSLVVFGSVVFALVISCVCFSATTTRLSQVGFAVVLGVLIAYGTIKSAPPMPTAPTKPYEQPLEICRPPYRPA